MKSKNFKAAIFLAAIVSGFAVKSFGCGPDFPNNLLDAGDNAVLQPPVADFKLEVERMKLVPASVAVPLRGGESYGEQSEKVELADLASALKAANVSDVDAAKIISKHQAERKKLNQFIEKQKKWTDWSAGEVWIVSSDGSTNPPPTSPPVFPAISITPGLPAEFADYFEGAIAWHRGDDIGAREAWERLLVRPAAERKFKSTWAAYMLGMACIADTNRLTAAGDAQAMGYFQQVGDLAQNGFADSAGLVTASIGREAQIELRRKNYENAIELYLEQFADGDDGAIVSLRWTAAMALDENGATPEQLKSLALNPQTRRVIMAYLVSRNLNYYGSANLHYNRNEIAIDPGTKKFFDRTDNWLKAVEAAGITDVESAEELALAAYQADDMDSAQRWANRSGDSPVAEWLQAKLDLRAGKIDAAAALLAKVSREFPQELPGTNAPAGFAQSLFVDIDPVWHEPIAVGRQASGELGVLRLARREYTEALDALLRSGYWMDAAYVAERVLTTDELKSYVDRDWPDSNESESALSPLTGFTTPMGPREEIRYLLARRLARETGGPAALPYFPTNYSGEYETLLTELRAGHDDTLPAAVRAKNLFAAAVTTRTNGMELFGTEVEPDWAIVGGDYDLSPGFWEVRATNSPEDKINLASTDEIRRASSRQINPDRRFHYRWQAAALAWEAAQLMPDNSDDTARVLCTGGTWLKDQDPQAADRFYKALVRRCRKTDLGQEADKLRWFPAQEIDGSKPRLETIEITPELTSMTWSNYEGVFSEEFPVPGRQYSVHAPEDVYIIARAVQRLGYPITVEQILQANPGLKLGPITEGRLIMIPETTVTNATSMPDATGANRR